MEQMDRSTFMKLAGAGSVAATVPLVGKLPARDSGVLRFTARDGLPTAPLASYATHIVEGTVDLDKGTGTVTTRVLAGDPGSTSGVGLPGLARIIRIDKVEPVRNGLRLTGVIEDRSQLRRGEKAEVQIVVDKKRGVVHVPFVGRETTMPLG